MEQRDVLKAIADGLFDNDEDALYDALKRRRKITDLQKIGGFQKGDKVRFNALASPRYLKNVEGYVEAVKTSRVSVQMPDFIRGDTGGRFLDPFTGAGAIIDCPVAIIDRVNPA